MLNSRLWLLAPLLATATAAHAADADGDGCEDVQYAANGACIAETASLAATVTTTSDTFVGAGASVGPFVDLDDVYIAPFAILDGWQAHSTQPLSVGAETVIGRRTTLGVDHILGFDTSISRAVTVGPRLTTGTGITIGYAADLGSDITLDNGAVVGNLVDLGDFTHLGPSAVIARSSTVADAESLAERSDILGIVGPDVTIGSGVLVSTTARVRKNATLGTGAQLGTTSRVGRGAMLGYGAELASGANVGANATIPDCTLVGAHETVPRGTTYVGTPISGCSPPSNSPFVFDASGAGHVYFRDVVTDDAGNIYITGSFTNDITFAGQTFTDVGTANTTAFVASLDPEGALRWFTPAGTSATTNAYSSGWTLTWYDGSVYVGGTYKGEVPIGATTLPATVGNSTDAYYTRLDDATGAVAWAVNSITSNSQSVVGSAASADGAYFHGSFTGNMTVDTTTLNNSNTTDAFVLHVDTTGAFQWAKRSGGTGSDIAGDIAIDADGDLIVALYHSQPADSDANAFGAAGTQYGAIVRMTPAGATLDMHSVTAQIFALHTNATHTTAAGSTAANLVFGSTTIVPGGRHATFVGELSATGAPVQAWHATATASSTDNRPKGVARIGDNIYVSGYTLGTPHVFGADTIGVLNRRHLYVASVNAVTATNATDWDWAVGSTGPNSGNPYGMAASDLGGIHHVYAVGTVLNNTTFGSNAVSPGPSLWGYMAHVLGDGTW